MEKNIIKEEIVEMLEVIVEQSEVISSYEKQIPQIEIDIILSNIRELYDKFKALEKQNKIPAASVSPEVEEPIIQETIKEPTVVSPIAEVKTILPEEKTPVAEEKPVIVEKPKEKEIEPPARVEPSVVVPKEEKKEEEPKEKEVVSPVRVETPVTIAKEEKKEIVPESVKEEKTETTIEQTEKKAKTKKFSLDLFSSHGTIADKFKDERKSLNEKHSSLQTDKTIASKLQKNPVKDLKAAIGINEKFKFINELFDGSLQKYNDCITQLNGFAGSEAAFKYMTFLKEEFAWKEGSEAFHELYDLVNRRYSS